jgi:glycosyltransferase involved in cell wall biosynthesis
MGGAERSVLRLVQAVHPIRLECQIIIFKNHIDDFEKQLEQVGVSCYFADSMACFYRIIMEIQPDICYLFSRFYSIPWGIIAKYAQVPAVFIAERGSGDTPIDWLSHLFARLVADGFIANSKAAADRIKKAGIAEERIFISYNGIEQSEINFDTEKEMIDVGHPTVVCIANILPLKGHRFLLKAIANLRKEYPDIKAVLVGKDYTNGKFFFDTEVLGYSDLFIWMEYRRDVGAILQKADIFALPSLREGMPTSILEAMLMAKPVVATRVGGIPELIIDGETGILVPPRDTNALETAIRELLQSEKLRSRLGNSAKDFVLKQRSISQMVESHLHAFRTLMSKQ